MSEVSQQFGQGNLEFTENTLDLAVSGDGFFVTRPDQNSQASEYTRAGAFQVDSNGFVVNSEGGYLQALPVNDDGTVTSTSLSSTINLELPQTAGSPTATTEVEIGANFQADAAGNSLEEFDPTDSSTYNSSTSLTVYDSLGSSHIATMYFVKIDGLEEASHFADYDATNPLSTADASSAANAIDTVKLAGGSDESAAAAAIAASGWTSPLYEAMYSGQKSATSPLGDLAALDAANAIEAEMTGAADPAKAENDAIAAALAQGEVLDAASATAMVNAWVTSNGNVAAPADTADADAMVAAYNGAGDNKWATFLYSDDGYGNSVGRDILGTATNTNTTANVNTPDYGIVEFTSEGVYLNSTPDPMISESINYPNGADTQQLTLDFANNSPTQFATPFNVTKLSQDGYTAGRLTGIDISDTGVVRANYSNGTQSALGKIALANFSNPQGLKQLGNTAWAESLDSGTPLAGEAGTGSFGSINSGALESSNVDLTAELVKLITAQRNFDANAKAIETASAITQTVIQMR